MTLRTALLAGCFVAAAAVALPIASTSYLSMTGLAAHPYFADAPLLTKATAWTLYAPQVSANWWTGITVGLSGLLGLLPLAFTTAWAFTAWKRKFDNAGAVVRAEAATHGAAKFATLGDAKARFPGVSAEGYGGIPVARNYRRDQSRWAEIPFEPRKKATWSAASKADMLVDPCYVRSTMCAWFAGSGVGKSQTLLQALAHPVYRWRGSHIVGDPKGELAAMTRRTRKEMGHEVYEIGTGKDGLNACDAIDPDSPEFVLDVSTLVTAIFPEAAPSQATDADEWVTWAKLGCTSLLLHMLSDPAWPAEDRNLRTFKHAVSSGQDELWEVLTGIAHFSQCTAARQNARSALIRSANTWAGVYASMQAGTAWLAVPTLADMVSDRSFRPNDICERSITVFIQATPKALKEAPGVARVLYGTLLRAAYDANGFIQGRILFDIDEAYTLGRMGIFEMVRDLGRSYGITVRWWFQSLAGQLEMLYRDGTEAWFDSLGYTAFAGVASPKTAALISKYAGRYGAVVKNRSENRGRSTQAGSFFAASHNSGEGKSETEVSRDLLLEHEVLSMADDEVVFLTRGLSPGVSVIRATLPLAFMDADTTAQLDKNPLDAAREAWLASREESRAVAA